MAQQNSYSENEIDMVRKEFVSVEEARSIIAEFANPLSPAKIPIGEAAGYILAEDIFSPTDIPAFDQSSVDGFAIYHDDMHGDLVLQGIMAAGTMRPAELLRKHAMRIFTGGPVPYGADTIVMQENVSVSHEQIVLRDLSIEKGSFIRIRGTEIKKGEKILLSGSSLSAPLIGLLASAGVAEIMVYPAPRVAVIATGNELQKPGLPIQFGQVYECGTFFLSAALQRALINEVQLLFARDDLQMVRDRMEEAIDKNDVLILTGGVSVGDYDFVLRAADQLGVRCLFHRVRQKPGKPFFFGEKNGTLVFGLPGNPASVITCFYEYVLPALDSMMNRSVRGIQTIAMLKDAFRKVPHLTQFLKGYEDHGVVTILPAQESYRLSSFSHANCMVQLDENRLDYAKGEMINIRRFPL